MSSGNKKNIDNARRFLWDEDEPTTTSAAARSRSSGAAQPRGFSTRDYAVDQSVNLMAMGGDDAAMDTASGRGGASAGGGTRLGSSMIAGLFRATTGTEATGPARFDEYGDAAPSADAEEYISDKRRRISPLRTGLTNCCGSVLDSCALTCGRLGLHGWKLAICLIVGLGLLGGGLYMGISGRGGQEDASSSAVTSSGDPRFDAIKAQIVQAQVTSKSILESKSSSPQKSALEWLTKEDPANLPVDHPAILDRYTLAVFYYSSTNALLEPVSGGWKDSSGWMSGIGICAWHGIECLPREQEATEENNFTPFTKRYDDNAKITGILLKQNNIVGEIPSEFGLGLEQLVTLDLQENQLSHTLPTTLGKLINLRDLLVRDNTLSGSLPSQLAELPNLHQLNLAKNRFEGGIPSSWSNMKELRNFAVSSNFLTGTFPNIASATRLLGLFLDDNDFSGTIPGFVGLLTDLLDFRISRNLFNGDIGILSSLKSLETLHIDDNDFVNSIPDMFDGIFRLHEFLAQDNRLTGPIPNTITHLQSLKKLNLAHNQLDGTIPPGLGLLTDGINIILNNNQFTGPLPTLLGKLDDIVVLSVSGNSLTGQIPSEIGTCFRLRELFLNSNNFDGEIPSQIGELRSLEKFHLEGNSFEGVSMPPQVCALRDGELSTLVTDCTVQCDCCTECL